MAYTRAVNGGTNVQPAVAGSSGGAAINIPNWGITVINNTSSDIFTMAPPTAGCQKTIVFQSSTTTALTVRLSTAQTVSFLSPAGTTYTKILRAAAGSTAACTVIELVGLNSTAWLLKYAWPPTTTPTPAGFAGSLTAST